MPEVGIFQYAPALHTKLFWATDAAVSQSFADFTGEIEKDDNFPESVFVNRMELHDKRLRYHELYGGRAYDEYFEVTQNEWFATPQFMSFGQNKMSNLFGPWSKKVWIVWTSEQAGRQAVRTIKSTGDLKRQLDLGTYCGKLEFHVQVPGETMVLPNMVAYCWILRPCRPIDSANATYSFGEFCTFTDFVFERVLFS